MWPITGLFFFIFVFSIQLMVKKMFNISCRWLVLNRGPVVTEATALAIVCLNWIDCVLLTSVTRFCDFWKFLATVFLSKVDLVIIWALLKSRSFWVKTAVLFLDNRWGRIRLLFIPTSGHTERLTIRLNRIVTRDKLTRFWQKSEFLMRHQMSLLGR